MRIVLPLNSTKGGLRTIEEKIEELVKRPKIQGTRRPFQLQQLFPVLLALRGAVLGLHKCKGGRFEFRNLICG